MTYLVLSNHSAQVVLLPFSSSLCTVTIALHKDCGVADQLKAALVVEILNYVTKYKDFAPVGCSDPSPQFRVLVDWFLASRSPLEWICHLWQQ